MTWATSCGERSEVKSVEIVIHRGNRDRLAAAQNDDLERCACGRARGSFTDELAGGRELES